MKFVVPDNRCGVTFAFSHPLAPTNRCADNADRTAVPPGPQTAPMNASAQRDELFADLLGSVRLHSSVYFRPQFRAPWGVGIDRSATVFHILIRGRCRLEVDGVAEPITLSRGDFVVLPRGHAHVLRDSPTSPVVDLFKFAREKDADWRRSFRAGGRGAVTEFACGAMVFLNDAIDPLLAILPPVIHVRARGRRLPRWLEATVAHVTDEVESRRPGADIILTRLADILFIHAVRAHFEGNVDRATSGWLAALRDRQIGRALALLHAQPHKPWTVSSLADHVAMSRSVFAAKFVRLVGEPPLRYLARLRLNAAAARLHSTDDKLSAIARAAGYRSLAAFTKAFSRHLGVSPGQYRRSLR